MDIFCIGEAVIDFLPGGEPASYIRNLGGAPANVAWRRVFAGKWATMTSGAFL